MRDNKTLTPCIECKKGYPRKIMASIYGDWICPNCINDQLDKIEQNAIRAVLKDVLDCIENPQHKHYSSPKRYIKSLIKNNGG
jgi:hypothetical protein